MLQRGSATAVALRLEATMDVLTMNWTAQLVIVAKVVVAAVLGAVIGYERELADKPAGLRTHAHSSAQEIRSKVTGLK